MDTEKFDQFLQDATLQVANLWERQSGQRLTIDDLYEINDLLDLHFQQKRNFEQK